MARTVINTALMELRGRVGDLVFKRYKYGTVVTRVPRMERVKRTAKQLEHQARFAAWADFHRAVLADPERKRKFTARARKQGWPLTAVTLQAFFRQKEQRTQAGDSKRGAAEQSEGAAR